MITTQKPEPIRIAFWKRPACYVLVVWSAFLAMHGYYFLLDCWNTPHPSYRPLLFFVLVQLLVLVFACVFGVWRVVRGPNRIESIAWLGLGLLPVFIWYSQVSLSYHANEERRTQSIEMQWYQLSTTPMAAALIDGVTRWTLPYQLEGDRVVMFYDDTIVDPERDLEEMDAFIKTEEEFLQTTKPTKIHWVRTPMLGIPGGYAISGVSVADPNTSPISNQHTVTNLIIMRPPIASLVRRLELTFSMEHTRRRFWSKAGRWLARNRGMNLPNSANV